ncbi:MAG: DUF4870 domain-containing protein [Planctomycetota bacterium]
MSESGADGGYEVDPGRGVAKAVNLPDDQRSYAAWIHWGSLIAWVSVPFSTGIAFFVPPLVALVMWQIKKTDHPFIDDHGREALNFQISLIIIGILLIPVAVLTCGIGAVLYLAPTVLGIVGGILAGLAANRGEYFRYPACIRVISGPRP